MPDRPLSDFLPFSLPDITGDEIREVVEVLESGWLTTGPRAHRFERDFAASVGARFAVALSSCTAALHLGLEAVGVVPGDEVILPTWTFAATGEVVQYLGAVPVLVDVVPGDLNIDPDALERAITPRTKAVLPVHFAGQACRIDRVLEIARRNDLHVIEDAAHAFPTRFGQHSVGSIGHVTCFSFYATKSLTTGEGGMATTDHEGWAERMRLMSLHGLSRKAWNRYAEEGNWSYEISAAGFKYNMSDISAALGLAQLRRTAEMHARRLEIARRYREAFDNHPALELLECSDERGHAWHLFVIRLRHGALTIDRDRFLTELKARGIGTSVHFVPLHLHPLYREKYGYRPSDLPVATDAAQRCLSLPIYSRMTDADTTRVIDAVERVSREFRATGRRVVV